MSSTFYRTTTLNGAGDSEVFNSFDISGMLLFPTTVLPLDEQLVVTLDGEFVGFEVDTQFSVAAGTTAPVTRIKIKDGELPGNTFGNEVVTIRRTTPSTPLVTFVNGARLPASDLNLAFQQLRYKLEEANFQVDGEVTGTDVPSGGVEQQMLVKLSDIDGDVGWADAQASTWYQGLNSLIITANQTASAVQSELTDVNTDIQALETQVIVLKDGQADQETRLLDVEQAAQSFDQDISDKLDKLVTSDQSVESIVQFNNSIQGPSAAPLTVNSPVKPARATDIDQSALVSQLGAKTGDLLLQCSYVGVTNDQTINSTDRHNFLPWSVAVGGNMSGAWNEVPTIGDYIYPDQLGVLNRADMSLDDTGLGLKPGKIYPGGFFKYSSGLDETDPTVRDPDTVRGDTAAWLTSEGLTVGDIGWDSGNVHAQAPMRFLSIMDSNESYPQTYNMIRGGSLGTNSSINNVNPNHELSREIKLGDNTGGYPQIMYIPPVSEDMGFLSIKLSWFSSHPNFPNFKSLGLLLFPDFDEAGGTVGDGVVVAARQISTTFEDRVELEYIFKPDDKPRYFGISRFIEGQPYRRGWEQLDWSISRSNGEYDKDWGTEYKIPYFRTDEQWVRDLTTSRYQVYAPWNDPYINYTLSQTPTA